MLNCLSTRAFVLVIALFFVLVAPGRAGFEFVHLGSGRVVPGLNLQLPQTWPAGQVLPGRPGLAGLRAP